MKASRNDPCPCGSGKKYKKCCYLTDLESNKPDNVASQISNEIEQVMQDQDFASIDDANEFISKVMHERNTQGIDAFHGLSPEQMHNLISQPFTNNGVLALNEQAQLNITDFDNSKVMFLALSLISAIGDKGIKATATGNLPRNLCRSLNAECIQRFGAPKYEQSINKEMDFFNLHVVRILLELAKLVRVFKGKYILTAPMKKLLTKPEQMPAQLFTLLFNTYCRDFNWAYQGYDESFTFIQQSVGFSMYMLAKYGDSLTDSSWYEQQYLSAFPMLEDDIEVHPYLEESKDVQIHRCYQHWFIVNFCEFFGLVKIKRSNNDHFDQQLELKTTALFSSYIKALNSKPSLKLVH